MSIQYSVKDMCKNKETSITLFQFSAMGQDIVVPILDQGEPVFEGLFQGVLECQWGRLYI